MSTTAGVADDLVRARAVLLTPGPGQRRLSAEALRGALVDLHDFWLSSRAAAIGIADGAALIAVGALGRRELCPYSDLDLVIVISPMSGPPGSPLNLLAASRRHSARLLRREVRALEHSGVEVLVFTPGDAEQEVMGDDMMSRDRLNEVIQRSFLEAGARAAASRARRLLRLAGG